MEKPITPIVTRFKILLIYMLMNNQLLFITFIILVVTGLGGADPNCIIYGQEADSCHNNTYLFNNDVTFTTYFMDLTDKTMQVNGYVKFNSSLTSASSFLQILFNCVLDFNDLSNCKRFNSSGIIYWPLRTEVMVNLNVSDYLSHFPQNQKVGLYFDMVTAQQTNGIGPIIYSNFTDVPSNWNCTYGPPGDQITFRGSCYKDTPIYQPLDVNFTISNCNELTYSVFESLEYNISHQFPNLFYSRITTLSRYRPIVQSFYVRVYPSSIGSNDPQSLFNILNTTIIKEGLLPQCPNVVVEEYLVEVWPLSYEEIPLVTEPPHNATKPPYNATQPSPNTGPKMTITPLLINLPIIVILLSLFQ